MGNIHRKLREHKILLVGLDAAGKTTLLNQVAHGKTVMTAPTVGFNVESVNIRRINFTLWDCGGQDKLRRLWSYYYEGSSAIIFVVDSSDLERLEEARRELENLLAVSELRHAVLLVYANKQDAKEALPADEMMRRLGLDVESRRQPDRRMRCQGSCATSGEGIHEGLEWLSRKLKK